MEDYERAQCRSCLSTTASEFIYMESSMASGCSYMECFNVCTDLKANLDDDLPATICGNCSHDLEIAYNFVVAAHQADAVFREYLQQRKTHQNIDQLEELECVLVDDEVEAKEIDILDDSQMETIQEEDDECEELQLVQKDLMMEDIKIELEQTSQINSMDLKYNETIKEEQQDLISQYYSEDERDDEYLIEYDDAENLDSSMALLQNNQGTKWKCIECKRVLRGDVSYEGHMNMHKNVKPYKCTKCNSAFRCKYSLERHVCEQHGDKVIRKTNQKNICCNICEKVFRSSEMLKEHQQTEHQMQLGICSNFFERKEDISIHMRLMHPTSNITRIQCPYCSELPFGKSEILDHLRQEHPSEYNKHTHTSENPDDKSVKSQWQCNICFNIFRSRSLLRHHCSSHINERPYACNVCGKHFTSKKNMRSHLRRVHQEEIQKCVKDTGEGFVTCEICNKNLLKKNIEKHLSIHERKEKESTNGAVKYICAYCPKSFKNKYNTKRHEMITHNPSRTRNFSCEYCDMKFFQRHFKMHHIKYVHSADRRIVCPVCGRTYKEKAALSNHLKTHAEKRFPCNQCEKKYTRQADLNVHMRFHTGELPYECHLCQKRFAIKVRLTYHLQNHMEVKHKCKICGKIFNNRNQLRNHKFEHTGFPYICADCPDVRFYKRNLFRGHIIRHHKRTPSEEELTANFRRNSAKTLSLQTKPIDKTDQE